MYPYSTAAHKPWLWALIQPVDLSRQLIAPCSDRVINVAVFVKSENQCQVFHRHPMLQICNGLFNNYMLIYSIDTNIRFVCNQIHRCNQCFFVPMAQRHSCTRFYSSCKDSLCLCMSLRKCSPLPRLRTLIALKVLLVFSFSFLLPQVGCLFSYSSMPCVALYLIYCVRCYQAQSFRPKYKIHNLHYTVGMLLQYNLRLHFLVLFLLNNFFLPNSFSLSRSLGLVIYKSAWRKVAFFVCGDNTKNFCASIAVYAV